MDIVQEQLQLNEIPHDSTVCKFSKRIPASAINQLFQKAGSFLSEWNNSSSVFAIDLSGFTPDSASTYYSIRTGKTRHDYLKTTIFVDTTYKSFLSSNITNSRCHDTQIAPIILRASHRVRKSTCYVLDKAYDSERIH
jgi:hypothetical protein